MEQTNVSIFLCLTLGGLFWNPNGPYVFQDFTHKIEGQFKGQPRKKEVSWVAGALSHERLG